MIKRFAKPIMCILPVALIALLLHGCGKSQKPQPSLQAPLDAGGSDSSGGNNTIRADQQKSALSPKEELTQRVELGGLGKRSNQNIAIINEEIVSAGSDLGDGIVVEKITDSYAELSFKGKRYRLFPPETQTPSSETAISPKNQ